MVISTRRTITDGIKKIARVNDTPRRTALAFSVGVFVAFTPLLGLHFVIAIALAFALRLNRMAVFLGTLVNNPWTFVFIYSPGLALGSFLMRGTDTTIPQVHWESMWTPSFWEDSFRVVTAVFPQLLLGTMILGGAAAVASYFIVLRIVISYRRRSGRQTGGKSGGSIDGSGTSSVS